MRLETYKMATSILLKFQTLKCDISKTIWRIEVSDGSLFCIFHALSFERNLFFDRTCPLITGFIVFLNDMRTILNRIFKILVRSYWSYCFLSPSADPTVLVDLFWFVKGNLCFSRNEGYYTCSNRAKL